MQEKRYYFVDPALEELAVAIERGNAQASVTLQIGSSILAGDIISYSAYLAAHLETQIEMYDDSMEEKLRQSYMHNQRVISQRIPDLHPQIIFMKDVTIILANTHVKSDLWRVRLDSVCGWYYGSPSFDEETI